MDRPAGWLLAMQKSPAVLNFWQSYDDSKTDTQIQRRSLRGPFLVTWENTYILTGGLTFYLIFTPLAVGELSVGRRHPPRCLTRCEFPRRQQCSLRHLTRLTWDGGYVYALHSR